MVGQILTKTQLHEVIQNNRFKLTGKNLFTAIDELSLLNKTAEEYGFEVDKAKTNKIIAEIFRSNQNLLAASKKYDGAMLQIKGDYSVKPEFSMKTDEGFIKGELYIFHETFSNEKHKILTRRLIEEKALELFPGCDEEYLYQAISDVTETYIFESLKKTSPELPVYYVKFDDDGTFTVKEMGKIS